MSVYVISDGSGFVKIGKATDVPRRMRELQTANPHELKCLHVFDVSRDQYVETMLHKMYSEHRAKNGDRKSEWFRDVVLETIEENVKRLTNRTTDQEAAETLGRLLAQPRKESKT